MSISRAVEIELLFWLGSLLIISGSFVLTRIAASALFLIGFALIMRNQLKPLAWKKPLMLLSVVCAFSIAFSWMSNYLFRVNGYRIENWVPVIEVSMLLGLLFTSLFLARYRFYLQKEEFKRFIKSGLLQSLLFLYVGFFLFSFGLIFWHMIEF
ncbi:MAG: hypothetical protein KIT45_08915 [Fimbriimonadia bacterium]|nr:hypothetical protein [Fimbriimonadia bacterium]